ncbi:MAG: hypothetical protein LBK62_06230 [Treponema sp.]|jgi:hypothetical protein|nr:hypothetical protein [Treponema sp.]
MNYQEERERARKEHAHCGDCGVCVHRDSCARSMGMLNNQKEWIERVLQEGWDAYDKVIKSGLKYEDYNWLYDALRVLSIIKDAPGVKEALENFYH